MPFLPDLVASLSSKSFGVLGSSSPAFIPRLIPGSCFYKACCRSSKWIVWMGPELGRAGDGTGSFCLISTSCFFGDRVLIGGASDLKVISASFSERLAAERYSAGKFAAERSASERYSNERSCTERCASDRGEILLREVLR